MRVQTCPHVKWDFSDGWDRSTLARHLSWLNLHQWQSNHGLPGLSLSPYPLSYIRCLKIWTDFKQNSAAKTVWTIYFPACFMQHIILQDDNNVYHNTQKTVWCRYLCQGEYVFALVCLFTGLSVSRISQGYGWVFKKFLEQVALGKISNWRV